MKAISTFFTLFWIIYFPTCIAYNHLSGFSVVDEVMTVVLIAYTLMQSGNRFTNRRPWGEYLAFLGILAFYVAYSLLRKVNVSGAVWLDLVQQIRPYSVLFCTWILTPRLTEGQKRLMVWAMVATLGAWFMWHPVGVSMDGSLQTEFPILGQLAINAGMGWYLFMPPGRRNSWIALLIVATGFAGAKMKFVGEAVCFVALIFFVKRRLRFNSLSTRAGLAALVAAVVYSTWSKFDAYYVEGWGNQGLARPMTYKTSLLILRDYFPLGSGMGTFATNAAWKYYSPLYPHYGLDRIWGLDSGGGFIADAFYPSLAQFGVVGVALFLVFWKRRLAEINRIHDLRHYRVALMAFLCLAIESTADSSYLSGKGMGYFMFLGLCLNQSFPKQKIPHP